MSAKSKSDLGAHIYWPDKRKRPIATVTPSDSAWLSMCGIAELWPSVMLELFPYQSGELRRVLDAWVGEGWAERSLTELLWPNGGPHLDLVLRLRVPVAASASVEQTTARKPEGMRFLWGAHPIRMRVENLLRLGALIPEAIQVDRLSELVVRVSINFRALRDCMCTRMYELPARTVGYRIVWPGHYEALFEAEVPADTTLKVVR